MLSSCFTECHCHNYTRESKGPVELGNPNTCAEVKLCLCNPALEIVCHENEVL